MDLILMILLASICWPLYGVSRAANRHRSKAAERRHRARIDADWAVWQKDFEAQQQAKQQATPPGRQN